jgi:hypothetical protein
MIANFLTAFGVLGLASDTVPQPYAIYAPVLAAVAAEPPSRPEWPILLSTISGDPCIGECRRKRHDADLLARLFQEPVVHDTFSGRGYLRACRAAACTTVQLRSVEYLPPGTREKMVPSGRVPGTPLEEVLRAIPESMAVPVDAAVDVVIHTPCPEPPSADRCRVADVEVYRYFLQRQQDGSYTVIGRWFTEAA